MIKSKSILKVLLALILMFASIMVHAQVNTGGTKTTKDHKKEIIGYITQWDAWKAADAGVVAGAYTQLNVDFSKYTILNYSFFGVAKDGSLHSGDFRNKSIWQTGAVQEPNDLIYQPTHSSWDLLVLFGEIDSVQYISQEVATRAAAQGFEVVVGGTTWSNPAWNMYNKALPLPLKKEQSEAKGLLELAKLNNVKVMASIGGWSMCKHFPEMAADPVKRARFIEDCKRLIAMGFDGIDLDWEYPGAFGMNIENNSPADYKNFEILVADIRAAIGPTKLITSAMSADPRKLRGFDWAAISQNMDYYNMMTYDMGGGWSGITSHNAPVHRYTGAEVPFFTWDDTLAELKAQGVPMSKVNFGIPFYGRGVVTSVPAALNAATLKKDMTIQPDGKVSSAIDLVNWKGYDGTPHYDYIVQKTGLGTKGGWTKHWDNEAQVPYMTNGNYFLSYDDEKSIAYKSQYIVDNQLAGTIVWTVYGDLEFGGTATSYGKKLKKWSNVKSPLINKVNEVFAAGPPVYAPEVTAPAAVSVNLGDAVVINATATDKDGQVVAMKATEGANLLAQSASGALNVTWTPTAAGVYSVVITATDNDAQTGTATVKVTVVDPTPVAPVVEITTPANNTEIKTATTATIKVVATATDANGDIKTVTLAGATATVAGDVYTFTIANVAPGKTYTYTVVATDAAGLTGEASVTVKVVKDTECPLPKWSATVTYTTETVCHNGIHYKSGWWNQGQEPGKSQWGPWTKVGSCGTTPVNEAPVVAITSPANNASVKAPANIQIAGTATDADGKVVSVEVFEGAAKLGAATVANGAYTFSIANLAKGTYTYKVVATDDKGATAEATVTVNVTDNGGTNPGTDWAVGVTYKVGDVVTYGGAKYVCTFGHTSLQGWEPGAAHALWKLQ